MVFIDWCTPVLAVWTFILLTRYVLLVTDYVELGADFPLRGDEQGFESRLWNERSVLGQQALKSLRRRGLRDETIRAFRLGTTKRHGGRITIPSWGRNKASGVERRGMVFNSIFDYWECTSCHAQLLAGEMAKREPKESERAVRCARCGDPSIPLFFTQQTPRYILLRDSKPCLYGSVFAEHSLSAANTYAYLPLLVVDSYEATWLCHQAGFPHVVGTIGKMGMNEAGAEEARRLAWRATDLLAKRRPVWLLMPGAVGKHWRGARVVSDLCAYEPLSDCRCRDVEEVCRVHGEGFLRRALAEKIAECAAAGFDPAGLRPLTF